MTSGGTPAATGTDDPIVEVWKSNIDEEFKKVRKLIHHYPYVSMVSEHFYL